MQRFRCFLAAGYQVNRMAKHGELSFALSTNIASEDATGIESNTKRDRDPTQGEMRSSGEHFLRTCEGLLHRIGLAWCYSPQREHCVSDELIHHPFITVNHGDNAIKVRVQFLD